MQTLTIGSKGPDVIKVKAHLAARGWPKYRGSDDDNYYPATAADVAVYQATHIGPNKRFLSEDPSVTKGVVGELTMLALEGRFDQHQGTITPELIEDIKSPRRQFVSQLIKWRKAGVKEFPKGSNEGPVISDMQRFHGMRKQPWCAMAVNYAHHLSLGTNPPWGKIARVCDIYNLALTKGLTISVNSTLCPGDILLLVHGGIPKGRKAPSANGHIWTFTGMDGDDVLGIDGNSDDRMRASRRHISEVDGVIRLWHVEKTLKFSSDGAESGKVSDR